MEKTRVGIVLFDDVEALDFCGPFEVFSTKRNGAKNPRPLRHCWLQSAQARSLQRAV